MKVEVGSETWLVVSSLVDLLLADAETKLRSPTTNRDDTQVARGMILALEKIRSLPDTKEPLPVFDWPEY